MKDHPDHSKEVHRINRMMGQLEGVKKMIQENRYCPDILVQTRAVASALRSLECEILCRHLGCCVQEAFDSKNPGKRDEKIEELLEIFQKRMAI